MVETQTHFANRLKKLGRKHAKLSNGYTTKVGRDGMISVKPMRRQSRLPMRGLVFLVGGFFVFKALMVASAGPMTYNERLAKLQNGSSIEQMGAWVLGIDPVTEALADFAGPVIR